MRHLLNYGADTERRDGEGHTALWCAVREQQEEVVTYLIHRYMGVMANQRIENPLLAHIITITCCHRGARVHYEDNDPSCPLQLACKTPLLKVSS